MSSNIKIKKNCQHCGQEFIARTTVIKYCGDYCAKKAYKAKMQLLCNTWCLSYKYTLLKMRIM